MTEEMFIVHVLRTKDQVREELENAYNSHAKLIKRLGQPNSLNPRDFAQWSQDAKSTIELIQANVSCIATYAEILLNEEQGEREDDT